MTSPTFSELSPVFAAYGNAVYTCHLLENGLRLLVAVASDARTRLGLADPASASETKKAKMLGDLFPLAMRYEAFSDTERDEIWAAIRLRNLLVHNYWTQEVVTCFMTSVGRNWLVSDISDKGEQIRDADRTITRYIDEYLREHGLTVESLALPLFAEYEENPGPPPSIIQ
jgi:hypothetical protein